MKAWHELAEAERAALTLKARSESVPLVDRWTQLDVTVSKKWLPRAKIAAELLTEARSVADLGCGQMLLETVLRADQVYIPLDLVRRDSRTIIVDFNSEPIPQINATHFAALGLLEYLYSLEDFLVRLRTQFKSGVLSFFARHATTEVNRLSHGWVNHQTEDEFRRLVMDSGFAIRHAVQYQPAHLLYLLD